MPARPEQLDARLAELDRQLASLRAGVEGAVADAIDRFRSDAAALRFHLRPRREHSPLVAVIGGTGTGKSTVVNRLIEANISATSFRRTFTSGAVAISVNGSSIPKGWLGVEHQSPMLLPARGHGGVLTVLQHPSPLTEKATIIDTPDLDGDQPLHHAEADRVFRWADALVFLVTPEKYQMTELVPYYRLARRYAIPAIFVMNKCEEPAVVDDLRKQLAQRDWVDARVFAVPRDDAAFEPAPTESLAALREAVSGIDAVIDDPARAAAKQEAINRRMADLLDRLRDQVIAPLRQDRAEVDRLVPALRAMEHRAGNVDVSPMTQQLQRRLQEQSVLYLMGPHRMLQRVRQVPGMILRLPRTLWDAVIHGRGPRLDLPRLAGGPPPVPDFQAILADQFAIVQSRIDDLLRSSPSGERWVLGGGDAYRSAKFESKTASRIADEEIDGLKKWLEQRWNKQPRDTLVLQRLLRYLPGGKKLVEWSEAAPYLLAIVVATHHAFFGPIDLMVVGGFSLATWLGEKISNEVTGRTRQTNRKIATRFEQLVHEQVQRMCGWLENQAPSSAVIDRLEKTANELNENA